MPEASIIIRAKNEETLIGKTLEMVSRQTLGGREIVIVDSGSTDRTLEIARQFTSLIVEVPPEAFTYGYALNVGCSRASGRYGVLLSAHAVPSDDSWLARLIDPLGEEGVAAAWGSESGWSDSIQTLPRSLSQRITLSRDNYGPQNGVWGFNAANAAIRLDLWRETPFDEDLQASEDKLWAWSQIKKGYKVVYVPEASVYHTHQMSPGQVYRRARREHRAVAEFMPELRFGPFDVVRGLLKRPRRGLWKEVAHSSEQDGDAIRYASYLGYRLACRFMYYWGLYRGLKDGRQERARGLTK